MIQQTIQQTDINKNDKNEKNIYRIPKKEEILEYVALLGKKIEIDKFIAYYDAAEWRDKSGLQVNWKQKALLWANSYKPKQEEITEYVYNPNT